MELDIHMQCTSCKKKFSVRLNSENEEITCPFCGAKTGLDKGNFDRAMGQTKSALDELYKTLSKLPENITFKF